MSKKPENSREGEARAESAEPDSRSQNAGAEVGYGKPPKHTRFAKGQSGNPRGRPRKAKPRPLKLSDAPSDLFLEEEAYRSITLRENGQAIELPAMQAMMRTAIVKAMQGNRLTMKFIFEYVARMEEIHFQRKVHHYHWLEKLKRDGERALAECERRGLPPPDLLPHPEDIVLNPATAEGWINGPATPEEVEVCEHQMQLRDHALLRSAHVSNLRKKATAKDEGDKICLFMFLAHWLDRSLPRRYRWTEHDAVCLMMKYRSLTRRERERRIDTEYTQLEANRPRPRLLTPEMDEGLDRIVQRLRRKAG